MFQQSCESHWSTDIRHSISLDTMELTSLNVSHIVSRDVAVMFTQQCMWSSTFAVLGVRPLNSRIITANVVYI